MLKGRKYKNLVVNILSAICKALSYRKYNIEVHFNEFKYKPSSSNPLLPVV